jgi:UDP-N-acetylmuramoyl-tripeptide--D-alanyl-D-alanine ligase
VFRNRGNLNNHIGLPLSLLELRTKPDIGVLELGMNHFGEISVLVKIAGARGSRLDQRRTGSSRVLRHRRSHCGGKGGDSEAAGEDSLLVANADDELVMRHARSFRGESARSASSARRRSRAGRQRSRRRGTAAVAHACRESEIRTPLPGTANLSNVLAATAVAIRFDIPLDDIVERAATLRPVARRGEVSRVGGVTIVDDSYNSNPSALSQALATLAAETRYARRIAVLGEMLELGEAGESLHRASGREAANAGLSAMIAVGGSNAKALAEGAVSAGMPVASVHYVGTSSDAADLAADLVKAGDLVLVKGSRGIRTEVVVDRLKAELA